jgi:predicted heme/steroid binding protein
MKQLDREELGVNDGREGRAALVAVDGQVYDVTRSRMWKDGRHVMAHQAGQDLSLAIQAAPHGPEVLERYEQVGALAAADEPQRAPRFVEPPAALRWVLSQHPHPVLSHFPIGLGVATTVFALGALVLEAAGLAEAAMWDLFLAAAAAPFSILAGLLSWRFNYGGIWTPIFRAKAVRLALVPGEPDGSTWHVVLSALMLAVGPNVVLIGRLGGKVTFPR